MTTLGDALPVEMARVRALIVTYRHPSLNGAGEIAARMMEASLQAADRAVIGGDLPAMIAAYEDLKGYSE